MTLKNKIILFFSKKSLFAIIIFILITLSSLLLFSLIIFTIVYFTAVTSSPIGILDPKDKTLFINSVLTVFAGFLAMVGVGLTILYQFNENKKNIELLNIPIIEIKDDHVNFSICNPINNYLLTTKVPSDFCTLVDNDKAYINMMKIDFALRNTTNVLIKDIDIEINYTPFPEQLIIYYKTIIEYIMISSDAYNLNSQDIILCKNMLKILDNNLVEMKFVNYSKPNTMFPLSIRNFSVDLVEYNVLTDNRDESDYIIILPPSFDITIKYRNIYSNTIYKTTYEYVAEAKPDLTRDLREMFKCEYHLAKSDYK